jgi:16S rRNA (guanine527-N7)-methyltransferase
LGRGTGSVPRGTFPHREVERFTGNSPLAHNPPPHELRQLIHDGLGELGLERDQEVHDRLIALAQLLASWAPRINLTGHRDCEAILRRLVLDAAALVPHLPELASIADVGSGAGFPGIPLAILLPQARLTSIEPRSKRVYFQRAVARELALSNVEILHGRSEDLSPAPHDLVIAQALAPPARAIGWMLPWSKPGGVLAIPTGVDFDLSELEGEDRIRELHATRYSVPLGGPTHQLLLAGPSR